MKRTIELTRIAVDGDTVKYEIHDNTGLGLLRKEKVEAQIQFHNADAFGFEPDKLPESVLALPITLYLLPVTFFYHIELILSSIDNTLYHNIHYMQLILRCMVLLRRNGVEKSLQKRLLQTRCPMQDMTVLYSSPVVLMPSMQE
jgi:hypothetical protein